MSERRKTAENAVVTYVVCQGCGEMLVLHGCHSITELAITLKMRKWGFGKYIKCPKCKYRRNIK